MRLVSLTLTSIAAVSFAVVSSTHGAVVLLETDFTNSGVTAGDMTGVVWTENGITAVTTLGATEAVRTGLSGDLDAEGGYFSANANVNGSSEGSPAWSTSGWNITVGSVNVELSTIVLISQEGNSGGSIGAGNGNSNIKLSISGVGFSDTQVRSTEPDTLTYDTSAVTLLANQTYTLTFDVWEQSSSGHYEGFDSLTINGDPVPEPSSTALLGLGGLALMLRRRR